MNILLSRTDRLGDLILSTPAVATVRRSFPAARIAMVCSDYNKVVMERNDDVDELVTLAANFPPVKAGARFAGSCDLAIALAPRGADFAVVRASRARRRVGYTYVRRYLTRATARRSLTTLVLSDADPYLSELDPHRHVRHEVNQLLDLVAVAGAHRRVTELRVDLNDADRRFVAGYPAGAVTFHLAQRWLRDGSTLESSLELLRALRKLARPLLVTSGAECAQAAEFLRGSGVADAVVDRLEFHQWAALFEKSACVVTVDTAATHLASAMRRPTVVAFEHRFFRLSSQEWAPYGVPSVLLQKPADSSDASLKQLRARIVEAVSTLLHA